MPKKLTRKTYEQELERLQRELIFVQETVRQRGLRVAVLMEGRDTAGKGGTIARIIAHLNPRQVRVVALGVPTEREHGQWYFQRYVAHLPTAGEIVLFDRSWYNRAGVERVMGFATDEEVEVFLDAAPALERLLARAGVTILKYWLEVSAPEQERRFQERIDDPIKRWKFSEIDKRSRERYDDYTRARDDMFRRTDHPDAPWLVVDAEDQRRARLNLIADLLERVPHDDDLVDGRPTSLRKVRHRAHDAPIPDGVTRVHARW